MFRTDRGPSLAGRTTTPTSLVRAPRRARVTAPTARCSPLLDRAADEIHTFDPDSRVIAMVRNPADQMHSQHSEMLFQGDEDLDSFADALAAEERSAAGRARPGGVQEGLRPALPGARPLPRPGGALPGALRSRPGDRPPLRRPVADPAATYRRVLDFLDVDAGEDPDFDVVNANKVVRSTRLRTVLRHAPPGLRRLGRLAVPDEHARAALRRRLTCSTPARHRARHA